MNHTLVIFEVEDADYKVDRFTFESESRKLTAIAVADDSQAIAAVSEYVTDDSSVTHIELCGGISSAFAAKLRESVPALEDTPIASVAFGFEALDSVIAYKQAYIDGKDLSQAFVYVVPGIATQRIDKVYGQTKTALIAVSDNEQLAQVGRKLREESVQLIEVYGWIDNISIATVVSETGDGTIPVGHTGYALLESSKAS